MKKPLVILPVFPGTNCDYDTARAFEEAGADTQIFVFRNLNETEINQSIEELAAWIDKSEILALSGGFSLGDEPDGSGKFIANVLNNTMIKTSVAGLLSRNGLILGICNGFQALVKSGLLPFAKIGEVTPESPTLFRNDINRHVSQITKTVVSGINSPWLSSFQIGEVHQVAISHGEGKFVVSDEIAKQLFENQQVAFQYCDFEGNPSMDPRHNPNGSCFAIEGIVSPCGKILGKMGHSERKGENLYKNIYGNKTQDIFANAVRYFELLEPSVITVGSFDGVHLGHQALLQQVNDYARKRNYRSVLVTFNPHPQEVLQMQPNFFLINNFEQKKSLFKKFGIDSVLIIPFSQTFSQITANEFFEEYIFSKINVKAIFMGPNHHFGKQREGNADTLTRICKEKNIELITTEEFRVNDVNVRSTLIRQYLACHDFQNAEKLMGHDLYIKK